MISRHTVLVLSPFIGSTTILTLLKGSCSCLQSLFVFSTSHILAFRYSLSLSYLLNLVTDHTTCKIRSVIKYVNIAVTKLPLHETQAESLHLSYKSIAHSWVFTQQQTAIVHEFLNSVSLRWTCKLSCPTSRLLHFSLWDFWEVCKTVCCQAAFWWARLWGDFCGSLVLSSRVLEQFWL